MFFLTETLDLLCRFRSSKLQNLNTRYLEASAKGEASDAVSLLMSMSPSKAILIAQDGTESEVEASMLQAGDVVKVGS